MSNNIDRIQEIKDRHVAATPGPWTHSRWAPGYVVTDDDKFDVVASVVEYRENGTIESKFCGDKSLANREFIAHAPDDIACLLSEYDRLDMELKIAREYTDELKRQIDHDDMNLKGMSDTIERMKEALEWYGERDNYIPTIEKPTGTMFSEVEQDCGEKARAILFHLKG